MNTKNTSIILFLAVAFAVLATPAQAFWIWTPESGKWVNPKYDVKPSPQEQLDYAESFFQAGKFGEAMREYKKLLQHYPKAREAAQAQFNLGRTWEEMKNYNQAVENYQKVVERYPFSDLGPKVTERQYIIANLIMEGKARDSHFANSLFGTESNVTSIFHKVIKNDPYGPYAPASQYKIGLYFLARGEYQEARDEFEKTVNDYPDSKWAESARYQIAVADSKRSTKPQYDQKVTGVAVSGFEDFVKTHPESELSGAAKGEIEKLRTKEAENAYVIADFYEKHKKFSAAKIYYQAVVDKYAGTTWAKKADLRIQVIGNGGNQ
ncbi:MAG: outer membrane protein assembly factor BamD [Candidatus Omnitrophica bacterium]|nr:outer membrane protein assembly factor BamD [Candidatus Omnitrophota bacterium]